MFHFISAIYEEAKRYTTSTIATCFAPIPVCSCLRTNCRHRFARLLSWTDNNYLCLAQKKGVHVYCFENQTFIKYKVSLIAQKGNVEYESLTPQMMMTHCVHADTASTRATPLYLVLRQKQEQCAHWDRNESILECDQNRVWAAQGKKKKQS